MTTSDFLCCICGREIEQTKTDPCSIRVATTEGRDQLWFCHATCFRGTLTTDPAVAQNF